MGWTRANGCNINLGGKMVEKKGNYEVVKVPTSHELVIKNPDGEYEQEIQLLVKIANDIEDIKKSIIG